MAISADDRAADQDRLNRTLALYRDLTVALRDRVTLLKAAAGGEDDCKKVTAAVQDHHRTMQTILQIEASLGIRSRASDGAGGELDLGAARAEILARLAVWSDAG
jgi:hypothetical protein